MRKKKLVMTEDIEEHIEDFYGLKEATEYCREALQEDLIGYLTQITENDEEIKNVINALDSYEDLIELMRYITNGEDKNIKDIERQAYVISDVPVPFERKMIKEKCNFTKEQLQELEDLNIPFSIKEIEKAVFQDEDVDAELNMVFADCTYLEKLAKKTKDKKIKKILKIFEDELIPKVPEKEVKEIHVYFPDYDEDLLFMDEEGLHKVVGKKARLELLDGRKIIGYLGSDFRDKDGDECVCLFEAYDKKLGFYNYNFYKTKDALRMDVLFYPRETIDFNFKIKVRHINKYMKGVTERKKK